MGGDTVGSVCPLATSQCVCQLVPCRLHSGRTQLQGAAPTVMPNFRKASCPALAIHIAMQVLKRLINKQRPVYARKTDPGMPSSHATSLSYLTTYLMITFSRPLHTLLTLGLALFLVRL